MPKFGAAHLVPLDTSYLFLWQWFNINHLTTSRFCIEIPLHIRRVYLVYPRRSVAQEVFIRVDVI